MAEKAMWNCDSMPGFNLILFSDSYKISHHKQYPPKLSKIKSYFESRGGKFPEVVFFGLQYVLKRYLTCRVTMEMIDEAEKILKAHFGNDDVFNREGWTYIVQKHGGKIPIRVCAVPEGTVVPVKNVLFTVESTDPKVPWVANYFETCLVQVWYPMTVCTNSFMQKRMLKKYLEKTADDCEGLEFKLHDFGLRGSTSLESGGIGGAAHLVNFKGTDNLWAMKTVNQFYGTKDAAAGFSIPATEHSTMTVWGKDREKEVVEHMLTSFPDGLLSIVSDSYDLWNFLKNIIGKSFKDSIENRKGTLVIRPDSGDPSTVIVKALNMISETFSFETNTKGYKVLPDYLRLIQGDGISHDTLEGILENIAKAGWSTVNLTFGSGGGLLQKVDRDTQKCAFKCCMAIVDGKEIDVYKDPVTDPGKVSKKGDIILVKDGGQFKTVRKENISETQVPALVTVFENGQMVQEYSFDEIRQLSNSFL